MSVTFSGMKKPVLAVGCSVFVTDQYGQRQFGKVTRLEGSQANVVWTLDNAATANATFPVGALDVLSRSVSFGTDEEDDNRLFNLSNVNAAAFLRLLQLPYDASQGLVGDAPIADVLRAIQRARASFDYRVDSVTRKEVNGDGAFGCRFFDQGTDEAYFVRRLTEFGELVTDLALLGADEISWG